MPDSKRLAVLKALTTHIASTVTPANGYNHDLTGQVKRGRAVFGEDDVLPLVSILENLNPDREPATAGAGKRINADWILLVQGWVDNKDRADDSNGTDAAHQLMADVKKALAVLLVDGGGGKDPAEYMLGGLLSNIAIEPGVVRPPQPEVSDRAFFFLRVVLKVEEDLSDPYRL